MKKAYIVTSFNGYNDKENVKAFLNRKSAENFRKKKNKENHEYLRKMEKNGDISLPDEQLSFVIEEVDFEE